MAAPCTLKWATVPKAHPVPLAAGSMAQVHAARWHGHRRVIVKVRIPHNLLVLMQHSIGPRLFDFPVLAALGYGLALWVTFHLLKGARTLGKVDDNLSARRASVKPGQAMRESGLPHRVRRPRRANSWRPWQSQPIEEIPCSSTF